MDRDHVVRRALGASAVFNVGGAILFGFASTLGPLVGLPAPVPRVYAALLAMFVLLFGGSYAWLARQPEIDRPLVALAAIGKASAFTLAALFWLLGDIGGRAVIAVTGDLMFALVFAWWLLG
jgi:hypothetical protein